MAGHIVQNGNSSRNGTELFAEKLQLVCTFQYNEKLTMRIDKNE